MNCVVCDKVISGKKPKKYCSRSCQTKAYQERVIKEKRFGYKCSECGEMFYLFRKNPNKNIPKFCTRSCSNDYTNRIRRNKKTTDSHGYIHIWDSTHPRNYCGRVREHVLIAEETIGRYLNGTECVHHKNHIPSDNRPENLIVCKDNSEHKRIEKETNKIIKEIMIEFDMHTIIMQELNKRYFNKREK